MPADAPSKPAEPAKPRLMPRSPVACFMQGSHPHHTTPSSLLALAPVG